MNTQKCITDTDLGRLWEGDVTPQEKQALQQHIETCSDCKGRWQRMSAGARHVEALLSNTASKACVAGGCLSEGVLRGFVDDTIDPAERRMAEEHLGQCPRCRDALADRFTEAYATDGDAWWSEYVGDQILRLFAQIPEQIDSLIEVLKGTREEIAASPQTIKLPIFKPSESKAALAAATGEGLSEQLVHQDDPRFDIHLVQFGRQVRIGVRAVGEDFTYKNCLGRLELSEAEAYQHSRVILIDKGEGQCVLDQADVSALCPQKGQPGIRFVPIVTLADLASEGSEAYKPILVRLLTYKDPQIRKTVIEVVSRIYGPQAGSLIWPLTKDHDESVRLTAQKALERFPQQ